MTSMPNTPATAPDMNTARARIPTAGSFSSPSCRHLVCGCQAGTASLSVSRIMGVTLGRQKGQPNITVIYDGEIIRWMACGNRLRKSWQNLGTCLGRAGAALGSAGFVQVVRTVFYFDPEHLARSGQGAGVFTGKHGPTPLALPFLSTTG